MWPQSGVTVVSAGVRPTRRLPTAPELVVPLQGGMGSFGAKTAAERAGDVDACEPPTGQILDGDAFLQRLEGDRPLARELLALFEEHVPAQVEALRTAVGARDASAIEVAAHGLKGVLNNVHAERAGQMALRLERMGRTGTLQQADAAFDLLLLQMKDLVVALQSFRTERLS